ncbi:hypothetical protein KY366_08135 [Candidatus Woesearchaeota archaeon]|nr:hypothetical protein [Candidatus Woesearchaeota archaeon]
MAGSLDNIVNEGSGSSDNLEAKANNSKSQGHSSPKVIKALDEIAKKRKPRGFFGSMLDYTIAAGAVAASYALVGPIALIANGIRFVGDRIVNNKRKRDTPSRQTRNSAIIASLLSIPGHYAFQLMNKLINVKTWSGLATRYAVQNFVYGPAMLLTTNTIAYPLTFGTTQGMWDYGITDLGWRNYKTGLAYFSWPNLAAARFLPDYTHFPISLGTGLLWRTTAGSRFLHEADPYKYEHRIIDGKPANWANKEYKKAA